MRYTFILVIISALIALSCSDTKPQGASGTAISLKPRVIVTSDGEIDDECSMVRFLLYANEWDIEGIITSSSQYHWHGHKWAGDDWIDPYLNAYTEIYPNLIEHDRNYPSPDYLKSVTFLGNVETEGEMDSITAGSQHIVSVLLDSADNNPVWLQAWGGTNTIARALKTIEKEHPDRMPQVAAKIRFFFIWEQDSTYQAYIKPHWGKYGILTIISDQFEAIAYRWKNIQPEEMQQYFNGTWMKENILEGHGPLCSLYKAHSEGEQGFDDGDFRSEGDSPAFLHNIVTGLRNMESPDWGGWGGRYVLVRENTWLDRVPVEGYEYPEGRWYSSSSWGRKMSKAGATYSTNDEYKEYFRSMWRWSDALQNDFAARADWCMQPFGEANHPPVVRLKNELNITARKGEEVVFDASGTRDPDRDKLSYKWWQYEEADTYPGKVVIDNDKNRKSSLVIPEDILPGETIHIVCEVKDDGMPSLTRYKRIVIEVSP